MVWLYLRARYFGTGIIIWRLFAVIQGLEKYGLQPKSGLLSVFANIVLLDTDPLL